MTSPIKPGMREVATTQLYRRNAFRITGLPTDADPRTVRRRQQKVNAALQVGADLDLGHDLPVDATDVARAFDLILGDPRRRLIDELFWWWDTEGAGCGCPGSVHREHDAAVKAHSAALDREVAGTPVSAGESAAVAALWTQAMRGWRLLLDREGCWEHVRRRIARLEDRQLGESTVDALRDELPATLVRPLIQLAATAGPQQARLTGYLHDLPADAQTVHDLREEAAEPLYAAVQELVVEVVRLTEAGSVRAAGALLERRAEPPLAALELLAPHHEHRRTLTARNDVGRMYNNCATTLIEELGPLADDPADDWLETAAEYANDPALVETIEQNDDVLTEMVTGFEAMRDQVDAFVAAGRPDLARRMLREVQVRMAGVPGSQAVDQMLADLAGRQTVGGAGTTGGRIVTALIFWGAIIACVIGLIVFVTDDDDEASAPRTVQVAAPAGSGTRGFDGAARHR